MSNKLERLREQRDSLNARLKDLETKQRKENRQLQARRHQLLGKMVEAWMQEDDAFRAQARERLRPFLTRSVDRAAFDMLNS
jgi:uncharacterized protein YigA (DUF484 family)